MVQCTPEFHTLCWNKGIWDRAGKTERQTLESPEGIGNLGGQPGARIPFKLLDTQVGGSTVSHDYVNFS